MVSRRSRRAILAGAATCLLLTAVVVGPSPASAEPSEPITTETTWQTECMGQAGWPSAGPDLSVRSTFPVAVAPGDVFTVRLAPQDQSFPNSIWSPAVGTVTSFGLSNVKLMYEAPSSAVINSVEIVEESGSGIAGTPTVEVDGSFNPARIVLTVPEVPADEASPTEETTYQLPAIDITLTAVGESGAVVSTRVPGTSSSASGYRFVTNNSAVSGQITCWSTDGPAPALFETVLDGPVFPDPAVVTTTTSWDNDCIGRAGGIAQPGSEELSFDVTAPAEVVAGQIFNVRIAPQELAIPPDTSMAPIPPASMSDVSYMFKLPMNAEVQSASIAEGTGHGWAGEAKVEVDASDYRPGRIVMNVDEVPANPQPPSGETHYQLPAIDLVLKATGPQGSTIATQMSGEDRESSGFTFEALSNALASVSCWPAGGGPAPVMSETTIVAGPESASTTTDLVALPSTVELDEEITLSAVVTAPLGTVQFGLAEAILGQVEVDQDGLAELTVMPPDIGELQYWAHYLGADGYEPSMSTAEVVVLPVEPDFPDVLAGHPFFMEIRWAFEAGIVHGYESGLFEPTNNVTRQAVAAFLYRLVDDPYSPDPSCLNAAYLDVPADHPFCGEIAWVAKMGITTGYDGGTIFKPSEAVTRQAVSAFLYRLAGSPWGEVPPCASSPFLDVPVDHPFCGEIAWMVDEGLANGFDDGTFRGQATVTRQATAAFLYRFVNG